MENLHFDLNESDRICAVSDNWDAVAKAQNAPSLLAENVIGKSVWPYIAGAGTQEYFAALFGQVRGHQQSVRLPYRCDAPMMRRFFVMEISKQPTGNLRIAHEIVEGGEEQFSVLHLNESAAEKVCSICLSLLRHGQWRDDYFSPRGQVPPEAFTVCPKCQIAAQYSWRQEPSLASASNSSHNQW